MRYTTSLMVLMTALLALSACDKKADTPTSEDKSAKADTPKVDAKTAVKTDDKGAPAKVDGAKKALVAAKAEVGKPAPEFALKDQDGKEHKLSQYKGKIVVLEWTCPSCPYVDRHYKAKTMANTHKALGADVVWLAIDSTKTVQAEAAKKWKAEQKFGYSVLLDASGAVGKLYAAKTTPHMFVIDAKGVLQYQGAIDSDNKGDAKEKTNFVESAVKALQAGKPVPKSETEPYGCSVKYAS